MQSSKYFKLCQFADVTHAHSNISCIRHRVNFYFSLCVGLTVCTTDRMMCVFTIFNCLHFCEINSYIFIELR